MHTLQLFQARVISLLEIINDWDETMKSLQKAGGMAALAEAAIYVALFTTYGTVLSMPANAGPAEQLAFLTRNQLTYSLMHLIGYVLFGVLLAVLVLALHDRLKYKARAIAQI